jgi:ATP-binding cassette, subfamily B, bacterial PglK
MLKYLFEFLSLTDQRIKLKLLKVQVMIIVSSLLETLSVLSIGPFMTFVASPDLLPTSNFAIFVSQMLGITEANNFLIILGSMIIFLMTISALFAISTIWKLSILGGELGADLTNKLYRFYIAQPLSYHLKTNTSTLMNKLILESNRITHSIIMQILHLNAKLTLILMMIFTIVITVPLVAVIGIVIFVGSYFLLYRFASNRLDRNGLAITQASQSRMRTINESFGGIKDVLINGLQEAFLAKYKKASNNYYASWSSTQVLSLLPRYAMELAAYGTIILAVLFLLYNFENDLGKVLPVIAVFGLASMKMLPAFQQCYVGISTIRANITAFLSVRDDLMYIRSQEVSGVQKDSVANRPLPFISKVELKDISFSYNPDQADILNSISIAFNANESTGIVGASGSGKSTAINILTGLLAPSSGNVTVDDVELSEANMRSWQSKIGFVSQNIFLLDTTIQENIAFGHHKNDIDQERIRQVIEMANLNEFINSLPDGIETGVGERGVQLSGGQLQRVGIARALYNNPEIIVFDEATSNLDRISEKLIMETISELMKSTTIIMIAHRLSTVRNCSNIFLFDKGAVVDSGNYDYLAKNNSKFIDLT